MAPHISPIELLKTHSKVFSLELNDPDLDLNKTLIKQHFFNREYLKIFTSRKLVKVYSALYTPSRSLCFQSIFNSNVILKEYLTNVSNPFIYCIGAGSGSELIGISTSINNFTIHIQDISDNTEYLNNIANEIKLLGIKFDFEASVFNILDSRDFTLIRKSDLITACFLLNELLSTSKREFVSFITNLVTYMKPGALFLVIDSAGSFSNLEIKSRQYSTHVLLDQIKSFEILYSSNSEWYRFDKSLQDYSSVKLENSRYYIRIYRKIC